MDIIRAANNTFGELVATNRHFSCITAGQVLLEVFRSLGVKDAYPLTVKVQVLNPSAATFFKSHKRYPRSEEMDEWRAAGCAIVKVGHHVDQPNNWPAHLVVVVPHYKGDRSIVIDLTIIQAFKPEWGVHLQPAAFLPDPAFLTSEIDYQVPVNECLLHYRAFPDDWSFEDTAIWKHPERTREVVSRILEQL